MTAGLKKNFISAFLFAAAVFLTVTAFFMAPDPGSSFLADLIGARWLSGALALFSLTLISVSLVYVNSSCFQYSSDSVLLYATYLLLILVSPGSVVFTEYHIVALLFVWAIFHGVNYLNADHPRPASLFQMILCVSVSSALFPPMVVFLPLSILLTAIIRAYDPLKYFLVAAGATGLPLLYIYAASYILDTIPLADYFSWFGNMFVQEAIGAFNYPMVELIYWGLVLLLFLRSTAFVFSRYVRSNHSQKNALIYSISASVVSFLLYVLFWGSCSSVIGVIFFIPFTFSLFNLYVNGHKKEGQTYLMIFIILSVVLRIYELAEL